MSRHRRFPSSPKSRQNRSRSRKVQSGMIEQAHRVTFRLKVAFAGCLDAPCVKVN